MPNPETGTYNMKNETTAKTAKVQKEVDEVKVVMEKNVTEAMARGEQLNDLEAKTLALEEGSKSFAKNSKQVSSNLWWTNMKYTAIIVGIITAIILVLVFYFFGGVIMNAIFSSSSR
jgi:uncharacterized integral membrane protein